VAEKQRYRRGIHSWRLKLNISKTICTKALKFARQASNPICHLLTKFGTNPPTTSMISETEWIPFLGISVNTLCNWRLKLSFSHSDWMQITHLHCQLVKSIWFPWKMRDTPMLMTLSWNPPILHQIVLWKFPIFIWSLQPLDIYRRAGNFTLKFWWMVCLYLYWIIAQFWRKTISHTFVF